LKLCDCRVDLIELILCFLERRVLCLLLVAEEAPVPVAAANLFDAYLVVICERLQVVLDMHAADSPDLRKRLLKIFDGVSLCSLVEPCEDGGRLLRVGLYFGGLREVSAMRM
jgi:hypothetical protein